jgi:hypothetical protein
MLKADEVAPRGVGHTGLQNKRGYWLRSVTILNFAAKSTVVFDAEGR